MAAGVAGKIEDSSWEEAPRAPPSSRPSQCRALLDGHCPSNCLIFVNIVQPDSFLTLHYRLSGPDGAEVVSTFDDKPATLSLGQGQLAPAIEACLVGMEEGARMTWHLEAGAAYGERNPEMLQRVKRSLLAQHGDPDEDYRVGDVVEFPTPDGSSKFAGVIREAAADWLLFDFNHPLAGQPVTFEAQLIGVM
jgi:FKBP-type peptidyl-prolyl cis-trans isomerase SlpA